MSKDNTQDEHHKKQVDIYDNLTRLMNQHGEVKFRHFTTNDSSSLVVDLSKYVNSEVRQALDRLESQSFGIKQDIPISQYPARSVYEPEHVSAINQVISKSAVEAERRRYE